MAKYQPIRSIRFADEQQLEDISLLAELKNTSVNALVRTYAADMIEQHREEIEAAREEYDRIRALEDQAKAARAALAR